jgi:DNA-binding CsgD family transcriptional regulator
VQYISSKEAAEKWGLTVRRIQDLCKNHSIDGAVRWGRDWMIPADANRPTDRRKKLPVAKAAAIAVLPRKNPAIIFSNIYNLPGTADHVANGMTERPVAAQLFRAQIAFCRGDTRTCRVIVESLLDIPKGHDLQIGCGVILGNCAIVEGDIPLWRKAKAEIANAHCHDARDRMAVDFWLAALECELRETDTFPLWFTYGRFDMLPGDSFPAMRYFYLRFLHLRGKEHAMGHRGAPDAQNKMSLFSCVAEPLIAQSKKEGALISEAYQRLVAACSYHDLNMDAAAIHHLDIAIDLLLPDKLYMILAEYRRQLDFLMDERLAKKDADAAASVKNMNKRFLAGWTKLQSDERGKGITNELTTREREVAKLAAFGLSNQEIADRLNISLNTVKQALRNAMDKTGAQRRTDLSACL